MAKSLYLQLVDNAGNVLSVFQNYWTTQAPGNSLDILNPANLFYTTSASNTLLSSVTSGLGNYGARMYAGPTGFTNEASTAIEIILENASNGKVWLKAGGSFVNPTNSSPNEQLTYSSTKAKSGSWVIKLRPPLYQIRSSANEYVYFDSANNTFLVTPDPSKSTLLELFNNMLFIAGSFSILNGSAYALQVQPSPNASLQTASTNLSNIKYIVSIDPETSSMQLDQSSTDKYFVSDNLTGVLMCTQDKTNLCFLEAVLDAKPSNLIVESWPLFLNYPFPYATSSGGDAYGSSTPLSSGSPSKNKTLYYVLGSVGGVMFLLLAAYVGMVIYKKNKKTSKM
jgi:hypothetical protein